jgi:hypothetical protein
MPVRQENHVIQQAGEAEEAEIPELLVCIAAVAQIMFQIQNAPPPGQTPAAPVMFLTIP